VNQGTACPDRNDKQTAAKRAVVAGSTRRELSFEMSLSKSMVNLSSSLCTRLELRLSAIVSLSLFPYS
jgi:hypothetical protein